ncbi:hypothetical protein PR048_024670 [Dryococelus australis]|uniref:Uncharacterized protein n=1 Tax=Dryococelus australis TaxID=614101 RepID=A0ABQ9GPA3_9NEOP|nr:hypothetical protein PR048_024670 [Dryococelus australis]
MGKLPQAGGQRLIPCFILLKDVPRHETVRPDTKDAHLLCRRQAGNCTDEIILQSRAVVVFVVCVNRLLLCSGSVLPPGKYSVLIGQQTEWTVLTLGSYRSRGPRWLSGKTVCLLPSRTGSNPRPGNSDLRERESCRTIPLDGWFSRGSSISPALAFRRCCILTSFLPHRLLRPRCCESLNSTPIAVSLPMRMIEVSMEQRRNEKRGKREIPEKTRRPTASSGTIPTCENTECPGRGLSPDRLVGKIVILTPTQAAAGQPLCYLNRSGASIVNKFCRVGVPGLQPVRPLIILWVIESTDVLAQMSQEKNDYGKSGTMYFKWDKTGSGAACRPTCYDVTQPPYWIQSRTSAALVNLAGVFQYAFLLILCVAALANLAGVFQYAFLLILCVAALVNLAGMFQYAFLLILCVAALVNLAGVFQYAFLLILCVAALVNLAGVFQYAFLLILCVAAVVTPPVSKASRKRARRKMLGTVPLCGSATVTQSITNVRRGNMCTARRSEFASRHSRWNTCGLRGRAGSAGRASPPTKANWVQIPAESIPIFARGNSAGRCDWVSGFSRGSPVSPPLHSGAAPYSSHFTLIDSQDVVVKSGSNISSLLHSTELLRRRGIIVVVIASLRVCLENAMPAGVTRLWEEPPWQRSAAQRSAAQRLTAACPRSRPLCFCMQSACSARHSTYLLSSLVTANCEPLQLLAPRWSGWRTSAVEASLHVRNNHVLRNFALLPHDYAETSARAECASAPLTTHRRTLLRPARAPSLLNAGGDKDDTSTLIKCSTAATRRALNGRAVFSSCCIYGPSTVTSNFSEALLRFYFQDISPTHAVDHTDAAGTEADGTVGDTNGVVVGSPLIEVVGTVDVMLEDVDG